MTRAEKRREWAARVEAFKCSGQSVAAWCEANNLKPYQLWYWLRKLRSAEKPALMSRWLPVEVRDDGAGSGGDGLSVRVGQAVVEVEPGFNPSFLVEVVRTLSVLC
jgi:hypothetical protein